MTLAEIHRRATLNRDCGLPLDADMIDALADVMEAAKKVIENQPTPLSEALARVAAIPHER